MYNFLLGLLITILLTFNILNVIRHIWRMRKFAVIFKANLRRRINVAVVFGLVTVLILVLIFKQFTPLTKLLDDLLSFYFFVTMLGYLLIKPKLYVTAKGIVVNYQEIPFTQLQTIRFVVKGRYVFFQDKYHFQFLNRHELNYAFNYFLNLKALKFLQDDFIDLKKK